MTIAELQRALDSKQRQEKIRAKEKASFDYILANMIAQGMQAAMSGGKGIPEITEVYPSLFVEEIKNKEDEKQAKIDQLSALRFKQFANFHNARFNKEVANVK